MVGLLGCGCCGTPTTPLCQTSYDSEFSDDFSPSYDPTWTLIGNLQTLGGNLIAFASGATWAGQLTRIAQKETVAGDVNVQIKLVDWQNTITAGLVYSAGISLGNVFIDAVNSGFTLLNRYRLTIGSWSTTLSVTPQDGDLVQLRLTGFTPIVPPPFPYVTPLEVATVQVLINGGVIYEYTGPEQVIFDACFTLAQIQISQPAFIIGGPNWMQVKLDDYYLNCE